MPRPVPVNMSDLYTRYAYYIGACVRRLAGGRGIAHADVEDLTQQVLLSLLNRNDLARFDARRGSFTTFLYWRVRTVVSAASEGRTRDPLAQAQALVPSLLLGAPVAERRVVAADFAERFEQRLRSLPVVRRAKHPRGPARVFHLLAQGCTPGEISARLHMPASTVFLHLRKIRTEARHWREADHAHP